MNLIRGKHKRISTGISELIPIMSYDDMLGAFVMKHGYMDIYGIRTYNMDALSPYEQDYVIMQRLRFQQNYDGELKIVDVNIRRLRIKIENDTANPTFITTVWGFGYKWGA